MSWRFKQIVPLVLTRQEAAEVYEALTLYRNECDLDDVTATAIDGIIQRMKRHTEHRSAQEPRP
jgi:hypothetical protein